MKAGKWLIRLLSLTLVLVLLLGSSALAGWQNSGGKWWYSFNDGSYARNNWVEDGGEWYYFGDDGYLVTGWQKIGGIWYYFKSSGAMATGWVNAGGWYHFNEAGQMDTGWYSEGGDWYFLGEDGMMQTGWVKAGNAWYYMDGNGIMTEGWRKIDGAWYYFNNGQMCTGTWTIDGQRYRFDKNGKLINNSYPVISSIQLTTNSIGTPRAYIRIMNTSRKTIDRVDFTVYCYDAYGRQIKGYNYYTHQANWYDGYIYPGEESPSNHYWDLYGFDGTRTVLVTITKYHCTDGTTVDIPVSQQVTYRN